MFDVRYALMLAFACLAIFAACTTATPVMPDAGECTEGEAKSCAAAGYCDDWPGCRCRNGTWHCFCECNFEGGAVDTGVDEKSPPEDAALDDVRDAVADAG